MNRRAAIFGLAAATAAATAASVGLSQAERRDLAERSTQAD